MPNFLEGVFRALSASVSAGRIGRVSFARMTARIPSGADPVTFVAALSAASSDWFADAPETLLATPSNAPDVLSAMIKYRGGQAALVSCTPSGVTGPDVYCAIVGSGGAVYLGPPPDPTWELGDLASLPNSAVELFRGRIVRSLASSQPESFPSRRSG